MKILLQEKNFVINDLKLEQCVGRWSNVKKYEFVTVLTDYDGLYKVNNRNNRLRYEICSKLKIKTPERRQRYLSGVFIVNFEHISHIFLMFLLLALKK